MAESALATNIEMSGEVHPGVVQYLSGLALAHAPDAMYPTLSPELYNEATSTREKALVLAYESGRLILSGMKEILATIAVQHECQNVSDLRSSKLKEKLLTSSHELLTPVYDRMQAGTLPQLSPLPRALWIMRPNLLRTPGGLTAVGHNPKKASLQLLTSPLTLPVWLRASGVTAMEHQKIERELFTGPQD